MRARTRVGLGLSAACVLGAIVFWASERPTDVCCRPAGPASGPSSLTVPEGSPIDAPAVRSEPITARPETPQPRTGESRWLHPTIRVVGKDDPVTRPYDVISLATLGSFTYEVRKPWSMAAGRSEKGGTSIPRAIRGLSGRRVAVEGFMVPMDYDQSGVGEFILNASFDMCSFGATARLNDWILVRMKDGRRTRFASHFTVWVYGRLEVGETWRGDQVDSLYRIEADFIGVPADMAGG
jgi:hypothetical protein